MRWRIFGSRLPQRPRSARRTLSGVAGRRAGPRGYRAAQCRRPGAGRWPFIGQQGPARARVRAHRGVLARRQGGERPSRGAAQPRRPPAIASSGDCRADGNRHRGHRAHRQGHRLRRDCPRLAMRPPETEFGRGIRHFGLMITRVIMLLVLFVLLVNVLLHRPVLESFFVLDRAGRRMTRR